MSGETVKVIVRVRPMNERERNKQSTNIVQADTPNMQIGLANPTEADTSKVFTYDAVFSMDSLQQSVYEDAAFPLVESVLEGYNGTIFAYGQTGCGKTHTMMGVPDNESLKGVIPRAFDHIFANIKSSAQKQFLIRCSYIEIYNEEIHDLVGEDSKVKLDLKESSDKGVFIKNLSMHVVKSVPEIHKLMNLGSKNRSVGETAMNKDSSRSHSIFTIYVETSENDATGNPRITLGKLNLVDLAGSERQAKTGATGVRLQEANKINLSLSALGNVISALVDGKSSHIPYRDSKLTRLLQDSLGGNTKTVMIANVSPASDNYDETLGTLRYASRAKNIKNKPKVNEDPKDALLREYADEILRLKSMLENNQNPTLQKSPSKKDVAREGRSSVVKTSDQLEPPKSSSRRESTFNRIENELKQKEDEINDERKKREELENKLKTFQQQMLSGGVKNDEESKKSESEKKKYQEMAQKLKDQNQKHEDLMKEKTKKEEEAMEAEKKYTSMQEEVEEQRKIIKRLRKKVKDANSEIKDLEREHELNKEDLLDTIRLLERDVKINNAIMAYLLSPEELEKIRAKARWHDDKNEFVVPPFVLRAKKVKFPRLAFNQALDMVQEEWENREIEFTKNKNHQAYNNDDDDDGTERDITNDYDESTSSKNYLATPSKGKDRYASYSPNTTNYGKGDKHNRTDSVYDGRNPVSLVKHSKDGFGDGKSFRDTVRASISTYSNKSDQLPLKKNNQPKQLEPIDLNHLSLNGNKVNEVGEKATKSGFAQANNATSLVALHTGSLPPMKGKNQLQPLNYQGGGANQKTMKLSFKATLLINNDGSNAELHNMSHHVKGY